MAVQTLSQVLLEARRKKIGVPNLWGGSVEKILGHVRAAEEMGAPLSLCYNHALCPEIPMDYGFEIILAAARRAAVPVAVILDHGHTVEACAQAVRAGASGVMYDGSHLPFAENVRNTQEVVRIAHAAGVSVEAEIGAVGGSSIEYGTDEELASVLTDPDQATEFAEATGVDALAISVGNSHGLYRGTPKIRHDLIREIGRRVSIPLVMHGASGLSPDEYPKIIAGGITKINYYSEMSRVATERMTRFLDSDPGTILCHNIVQFMIEVYLEETKLLYAKLGYRVPGKEQGIGAGEAAVGSATVEEITAIVLKVLQDYRSENGSNRG